MPAQVSYEVSLHLKSEVRRIIEENPSVFDHVTSDNFVVIKRVSEKPAKWIAKTSVIPKKFQALLGADFVIEVDDFNFSLLKPERQEAILFRELCSTFLTENGTYKIVKPDVQEYLEVIRKYGTEIPEILKLLQVQSRRLEKATVPDSEDE